jgi:predicted hydrocarbon binding protein
MRIILNGYQEVMGNRPLAGVLESAGLEAWEAQYPPDNLAREVHYESCAAFHQALDETYGPLGSSGLAIRAGRSAFNEMLQDFGSQMGIDQLSFKLLPLREKIAVGVQKLAELFGQISDQSVSVAELPGGYRFRVQNCPVCWGRQLAGQAACYHMVGVLQECLSWLSSSQDWQIVEASCVASGDMACEFEISRLSA